MKNLLEEQPKRFTYTLKQLVDKIQPIVKENISVVVVEKLARGKYVYRIEIVDEYTLYDNEFDIYYETDLGSSTKQAIKNYINMQVKFLENSEGVELVDEDKPEENLEVLTSIDNYKKEEFQNSTRYEKQFKIGNKVYTIFIIQRKDSKAIICSVCNDFTNGTFKFLLNEQTKLRFINRILEKVKIIDSVKRLNLTSKLSVIESHYMG